MGIYANLPPMNRDLNKLHPYPFEKLMEIKQGIVPVDKPAIALSIGEPKHPPPEFVLNTLAKALPDIARYPLTKGSDGLRECIRDWLNSRFHLTADTLSEHRHIIPVNGTREALFAIAQTVVDRSTYNPQVLMPNPFYQIYEGAVLLAGAEPVYMNCTEKTQWLPDLGSISEQTWQNCQLIYTCSPSNPSGAVMDKAYLERLIELSFKYNFTIAADECYSEIYRPQDSPPIGLLEVASAMGVDDFKHCLVFHSLSKRSNLAGLRSGFVAGDGALIKQFLRYRTYHGCAMSLPLQQASCDAWNDESHVVENRRLYEKKFDAVLDILQPVMKVERPQAGFYLWADVADTRFSDVEFAAGLFKQQNVTVLPGSFLSRDTAEGNPGDNRLRMALVASVDECIDAAHRIKEFIQSN
jgi:N-succinyldiaminopimelate aminotransferase